MRTVRRGQRRGASNAAQAPDRRSRRLNCSWRRPSSVRGSWRRRLAGGKHRHCTLGQYRSHRCCTRRPLIGLLGPVSGAHFNPAVSLVEALRGKPLLVRHRRLFTRCKSSAVAAGALLAHAMFSTADPASLGAHQNRPAQWLAPRALLPWVSCSSNRPPAIRKMPPGWSRHGSGPPTAFTASTSLREPGDNGRPALCRTHSRDPSA